LLQDVGWLAQSTRLSPASRFFRSRLRRFPAEMTAQDRTDNA
jgi:hypothetical protein